jgi:hypothetical protein
MGYSSLSIQILEGENMKVIQFSVGSDPGVSDVLSPFSGQRARVRRFSVGGPLRRITQYPRSSAQLLRIPQLGYSLETVAFAVCAAASLAVVLMPILGVS